MDVAPFKGFFSSLTHFTQLNFEIWNGNGFIFSSGAEREKVPSLEKIQDMSAQIIRGEAFHHTVSPEGYVAFGVPIRNGEAVNASLIAHCPEDHIPWVAPGSPFFRRSHVKEVELFLTYLASIIEDKWSYQREIDEMAEELSRNFADLYLYSRMAAQLRTLNFSGNLLDGLVGDLLETMRVDLAFVELQDRREYNVFALGPEISRKIPDPRTFIKSIISGIPEDVTGTGELHFTMSDSRALPAYSKLYSDPFRILAVKLRHNKIFYGWLGMVSFNLKEIFRRSELSLLGMMAEQIAIVIANTDLYRDLERFVINVVRSLVQAIEAKDLYTRGHSERVNRYSMWIASELSMKDEEKNTLHWASMLHDIGKIGISENILNKPDRLTDEEYALIKSHPAKGQDILAPIEQLKSSLAGTLHHHERYDGRGYPNGLKGEGIPFMGRLIAIADTFDAITSNRAYRSAKSAEEALTIMDEVSGTQLDPFLVRCFKEALRKQQEYCGKEKV